MNPILILIFAQALFSGSDLMARQYMSTHSFSLASFLSVWFLAYQAVRFIATMGQLYVLSNLQLGRSQTLFGVSGLIIANLLGVLLLGEKITPSLYLGIVLAILAFIVVALAKA